MASKVSAPRRILAASGDFLRLKAVSDNRFRRNAHDEAKMISADVCKERDAFHQVVPDLCVALMIARSSSVSGPGLRRIASGVASLPMSCSQAPIGDVLHLIFQAAQRPWQSLRSTKIRAGNAPAVGLSLKSIGRSPNFERLWS